MQTIISFLQDNTVAAFWIMAAIVFFITQAVKLPIKAATKRLKESTRKKVNSIILLLPFAFGVGIEVLYNKYITHDALDIVAGIILGGQSIAFYGIIERFFNVKIKNPYETDEGKVTLDAVNDAVSDGKVTGGEVADIITNVTTAGKFGATIKEKIKKLFTIKKKSKEEKEKTASESDALKTFLDNIGK